MRGTYSQVRAAWSRAHKYHQQIMVAAYILVGFALVVDHLETGNPLQTSIPGAVITTLALVVFLWGLWRGHTTPEVDNAG